MPDSSPPAAPASAGGLSPSPEPAARFAALVASPLRAELLRRLHARLHDAFELHTLAREAGCLRLDVERCLAALAEAGLAERIGVMAPRWRAAIPADPDTAARLGAFLDAPAVAATAAESVERLKALVGRDETMIVVLEALRVAAKSDLPALILGPRGSPVRLAAQAIHALSRRAGGPFVTVAGDAWTDEVSGDALTRDQALERAHLGVLCIDDIADLSAVAQTDIAERLGSRRTRSGAAGDERADVRLIAISAHPLDHRVREGRFRADLLARLHGFAVRIPSLAERSGDIPLLAQRTLEDWCASVGRPRSSKALSPSGLKRLQAYSWPGDLQELEEVIARAAVRVDGPVIQAEDVAFAGGPEAPRRPVPTLREVEQVHIRSVLQATRGNKKEAARLLAISRGTLYRKIEEYELERILRPGAAATPAPRPS
jgi:DNA-binding NtrC family response regulator